MAERRGKRLPFAFVIIDAEILMSEAYRSLSKSGMMALLWVLGLVKCATGIGRLKDLGEPGKPRALVPAESLKPSGMPESSWRSGRWELVQRGFLRIEKGNTGFPDLLHWSDGWRQWKASEHRAKRPDLKAKIRRSKAVQANPTLPEVGRVSALTTLPEVGRVKGSGTLPTSDSDPTDFRRGTLPTVGVLLQNTEKTENTPTRHSVGKPDVPKAKDAAQGAGELQPEDAEMALSATAQEALRRIQALVETPEHERRADAFVREVEETKRLEEISREQEFSPAAIARCVSGDVEHISRLISRYGARKVLTVARAVQKDSGVIHKSKVLEHRLSRAS